MFRKSSPFVKYVVTPAAALSIGSVTLWTAIHNGKAVYLPESGDLRDLIVISRLPANTNDGARPNRYEVGVVEGTASAGPSMVLMIVSRADED